MKAAAYIRVSTAEQEDGASLTEQKRDIEEYCNLKGYELVATYQDVASGASRNRPQFKAMLKDARAGAFQVIVAWKADRLYRGGGPAYALREALTGVDVRLEAVRDTIDPKGLIYFTQVYTAMELAAKLWLCFKYIIPDSKYFGLLAEIGGLERESIIERTRMGAKGRARAGKITGTPRYGYLADDEGFPQVNPDEAAIVQRIFTEYLNGHSCNRIARMLTEEGTPSRTGKAWQGDRIHSIISNPVYIGQGRYGRKQNIYRDSGESYIKEKKHAPEDTWLAVPYPAIIDEPTFKKAQAIRRNQARVRNGDSERVSYPLKGVLWCGDCGYAYSPQTNHYYNYYTRKDGTKVRRRSETSFRREYRCIRAVRLASGCSSPRLSANSIEALVWRWFNLWLMDQEHVDSLIENRRRYLQENGVQTNLARHHEALTSLDQEQARLLTAYQKGYLSEEDLDVRLDVRMKGLKNDRGIIGKRLIESRERLTIFRMPLMLLSVFASMTS